MSSAYATNGRPAPTPKPKALDEFADRDGVLSRYFGTTADKALQSARISREQAENLGFYFKDANPHDRVAVYQEYGILSKIWNLEVFGSDTKFAANG